MSHTIANSNSVNESLAPAAPPHSGCKHHTRKGRCRMPVADPATSLCFDHARRRNKRDEASDLAAELVAGLSEFKSAVPINDFLSASFTSRHTIASSPAAPPSWPTPPIFSSAPSPPSSANSIPKTK